jgi:hypothetical protein
MLILRIGIDEKIEVFAETMVKVKTPECSSSCKVERKIQGKPP